MDWLYWPFSIERKMVHFLKSSWQFTQQKYSPVLRLEYTTMVFLVFLWISCCLFACGWIIGITWVTFCTSMMFLCTIPTLLMYVKWCKKTFYYSVYKKQICIKYLPIVTSTDAKGFFFYFFFFLGQCFSLLNKESI